MDKYSIQYSNGVYNIECVLACMCAYMCIIQYVYAQPRSKVFMSFEKKSIFFLASIR